MTTFVPWYSPPTQNRPLGDGLPKSGDGLPNSGRCAPTPNSLKWHHLKTTFYATALLGPCGAVGTVPVRVTACETNPGPHQQGAWGPTKSTPASQILCLPTVQAKVHILETLYCPVFWGQYHQILLFTGAKYLLLSFLGCPKSET